MDYTMDTLSMENVPHYDMKYASQEAQGGGASASLDQNQQFVQVGDHLTNNQQIMAQTNLQDVNQPLVVGASLVKSSEFDALDPNMQGNFEMQQSGVEQQLHQTSTEMQGSGHDQENRKQHVGNMFMEEKSAAQQMYYGVDNRQISENMEIDQSSSGVGSSLHADNTFRIGDTVDMVNEHNRMEVSSGSYEPVVSDFLPETPKAKDIPDERDQQYTKENAQQFSSLSQEQHIQGHTDLLLQSHTASVLESPDNHATNVQSIAVGSSGPQNLGSDVQPMSGDQQNCMSDSMENAQAVEALTAQLSGEPEASTLEPQTRISNDSHLQRVQAAFDDHFVERKGNQEVGEQNVVHATAESKSEIHTGKTDLQDLPKDVDQSLSNVSAGQQQISGEDALEPETADLLDRTDADSDKTIDNDDDLTMDKEEEIDKAASGDKNMPSDNKEGGTNSKNDKEVKETTDSIQNKSIPSTDEDVSPVGMRKRFKCQMCSRSYRHKKDLNRHMKSHAKTKKPTCTVCGAVFKTQAALKKHSATHTKSKSYPCSQCSKTCRSLAELKSHQRTHSDVRSFSCTKCSYTAKKQKDLSKHMVVHTESKVHNCQFCKFSSKRKYSLQRHMKTAHSSARVYTCTACNFKSSAVDSFKVHVAMHASTKSTSCIICGAVVKKRPNLIEHLLSHSNDQDMTCKECEETSSTSYEFMLHLLSHRDTPSTGTDDGNQASVFDLQTIVNGSTDPTAGTFGFMARKNKMVMDTPTMEAKISQMSSTTARLAEMTKVVSLLNEKSKVVSQLAEVSNLATELAVISGNVLQSYKNMYGIGTGNTTKTKSPSTTNGAGDDSSLGEDDFGLSSSMSVGSTTIKEELQDNFSANEAGMQIQVDFNGEPVSCVQKDDNVKQRGSAKVKGEKEMKCTRCSLVFTDTRSLKRHLMAHDDVRPYSCEKCGQSFRRNEHLKKHMVTHSDERPFVCKECPYAAKTEHRLKIHMMSHSQTKSFACPHCNYTARANYELNHHMKRHEPRNCSQCDFVCYSRAELKKHMFTHSTFDCNECDFTTSDRSEYTKHVKKHSLVQHLCCELCGYSCDTMKKFKYHKLRHENKTPYQCPDCDYKCSSRASYDCHRLKHAGLKPYLCSFCGAAFRKTSHLNQHLLIHKDEKAFKCSECGYACRTKHNLKEHEMTHSGEKPFACKYCSFSCRRNKALQLHMLKHENQGMMMAPMQMPPMQMPQMQMPLHMPMMPTGL